MSDPRQAAYRLVQAVRRRDAYANLALRSQDLGPDAALATELGYGALRWQGSLDVVISHCAHRPLDKLQPQLLDALRVGAYQVLHTRIPAHAAVATGVDLARTVAGAPAAKLANAVLRRISEHTWSEWTALLAPADQLAALAFRYGYPEWIARAFADALGERAGELEAALAAGAGRPVTHLVARPGRIAPEELLQQAGSAGRAGRYSPLCIELSTGDPGQLPAVRAGLAAVQDEGSQLVALALAAADPSGPDRRWLDLAAGPGGKTAILAGLAQPRAAQVVAGEVSATRAGLVARAAPNALVVRADGRRPPWRRDSFDRVLLDAPCSGLGSLRRRPDLKWRRTPQAVERLGRLQGQLLVSALWSARAGGAVGYVTCSPHLAETRWLVDEVLEAVGGVQVDDARPLFAGVPDLGPGPYVQLWPHRHGCDAMFFALLRPTLER